MKILVLSNGWTTRISGGDEHIIQVAKYWSRNHDVTFIFPSLGYYYVKQLLPKETKVKAYVYNTLLERPLNGFFKILILYLLRILRLLLFSPKHYYDIIVSSSHYPYDVIPAILLKLILPGSKLVVYFHGLSIPYRDFGFSRLVSIMANYLGALLIKLFADLVFVVNKSTANFLLSLGVGESRIFKTDNGVPINEITSAIYGNKVSKKFDGCFIGRLVRYKGIYDLLEVWKAVCKFKPDAKLVICGTGEEAPKIAELLKKKKMEPNVTLLGFVYGKEKYNVSRSP